jgi:transcription antitermination factor NusG
MGKVWYVLRAKPNKEAFLAGQLESRNITVLDLQVKVNPVNPRARRFKPYFPGYIFIQADLQKHPPVLFERIPCAARLVHIGDEIAFVPDTIIQAIRTRVEQVNAAGGEVLDSLNPGDRISVQSGPFEGYEGILDMKIPGTERVRILLQMLHDRKLVVEVPAGQVALKKTPAASRQ